MSREPPPSADSDCRGLASQWEDARGPVFAQLLAGIGSFHDAEDVLQEVAISVARDFAKYDPQRPFVAWALGIARNKMLMYYRKQSRERLVFSEEMLALAGTRFEQASRRSTDGRREAISQCIESLDADRREILHLRYGADLSMAEIACRTHRSVEAIKALMFRVRQALTRCVQQRLASKDR
ncbi:MAG: sigma-70 family RNA polymerase sigma factor [Planctomycetales bacterium]|nr:sigma-70 family RNA polymerase sigma factor [Planctomycetales bacterium]